MEFTFENAKKLIAGMHREYEERIESGEGTNEAIENVMDGYSDPESIVLMLWGTGVLFDVLQDDDFLSEVENAIIFG